MRTTAIKTLIIRPDHTFDILDVEQNLNTIQELVGGYFEPIHTDRATIIRNEDGKRKGMPANKMATYLWWKLQPEYEGQDQLLGCCLITGPHEDGELTDITQDILDLYGHLEGIRRDTAAGRPC